MQIDIRPGHGQWWVVAYLPSGKAHDCFDTQREALAFALAFYGGRVVDMAKQAA